MAKLGQKHDPAMPALKMSRANAADKFWKQIVKGEALHEDHSGQTAEAWLMARSEPIEHWRAYTSELLTRMLTIDDDARTFNELEMPTLLDNSTTAPTAN